MTPGLGKGRGHQGTICVMIALSCGVGWLKGMSMVVEKLTTYDPAEDLVTSEAITTFMAEAFETEDAGYIAHALGVVARAKGMTQIASETGLSREQLYRSISEKRQSDVEDHDCCDEVVGDRTDGQGADKRWRVACGFGSMARCSGSLWISHSASLHALSSLQSLQAAKSEKHDAKRKPVNQRNRNAADCEKYGVGCNVPKTISRDLTPLAKDSGRDCPNDDEHSQTGEESFNDTHQPTAKAHF